MLETIRKILTACQFKAADDSATWEGYGSTFGNEDAVGDVMEPGCFAASLSDFKSSGFLGLGHDWSGLPIGYISEAKEDARGLWLSGGWHDTTTANDARKVARERLAAGKSVGLSIGFRAERYEPVDPDEPYGARRYKAVKLYEVSLVTVPCNEMAGMTSAKGMDLDALEETLRGADRERLAALSQKILNHLKSTNGGAAEAHRIATSSAIARAIEGGMNLARLLN